VTSSFFGLDLSLGALQAQQLGLDATGHNVANANTRGFSRQSVQVVATTPFTEPGSNKASGPGQIGTGAYASGILRARDLFPDIHYRNEIASGSQATVTRDSLEQVEVVFNEPSDTGIGNLVRDFYNSWQGLTNDPTDGAARSTVVQQASALADAFNRAAQNLTTIQSDLNSRVSVNVQQVNSLTSQMNSLNKKIVGVEVSGQRANDFRDRRDSLLDELAAIVPINVSENPGGSVSISIGSNNLVSPGSLDFLTTTPTGPGGMLEVKVSSNSSLVSLSSGELKGLIDVRDVKVPGYLSQLDTIAGNLITAVNAIHTTGYGADGINNRAFFTGTTAATMKVNPVIGSDPQKVDIAAAANQHGDGSIALAIAQLQNTMSPSSESAYSGLITALGVDSRTAQDQSTNQDSLVQLSNRRRQDISGVSLDEEATNLIHFQRAHEAAARVMTTYDQMLDTLVNRTGAWVGKD
jgi:flagellar hook-associated protein 1 FlgK